MCKKVAWKQGTKLDKDAARVLHDRNEMLLRWVSTWPSSGGLQKRSGALDDFVYSLRLSKHRINAHGCCERLAKTSAYIANAIIRTWGSKPFRTEAASKPFMRGIDKSNRIRSGLSFIAFSMDSKGPASRAGVLFAHDLGTVLGVIGHALDVPFEYHFGDFGREEGFVGADGVDGGDEIAHGVSFEDVAERARVEHFLNYFGRVMDGENEDFGARAAINKLAGRVEPIEHRHADVEQSYVGVQEGNFLDGFFAVACFANHSPTKLRLKEIAQTEPDNFVIVSQEKT